MSLRHPFPALEAAASGFNLRAGWRAGPVVPTEVVLCSGGTESFFAEAPQYVCNAKTVFPLRPHSLFLTTGTKALCCFPASERGQLGRTHAISEHGNHLSSVSH